MTLREALKIIPGLSHVIERCEPFTADGRNMLMSEQFSMDLDQIKQRYDALDAMSALPKERKFFGSFSLAHRLMELKGCRNTLERLRTANVLDVIELFELKYFILIADAIKKIIANTDLEKFAPISDLSQPIQILDPENTRTPHFYIYEAYDSRLASLRKDIQRVETESEEFAKYTALISDIEIEVTKKLSAQLLPYADAIIEAYESVTYLDFLLAKFRLTLLFPSSVRPEIAKKRTSYVSLINASMVTAEQNSYCQPIDIELNSGTTVITGANMSGKTVVLKTLALAQALFQFGFYVPAEKADIVPVKDICLSIGDEQSTLTGLSSYAAEMMNIDRALKMVRTEHRVLVLIDEPARTTNPSEGSALVSALVEILDRQESFSLLTTHYTLMLPGVRRLRVSGFRDDKAEGVTVQNIQKFMDYSLVEDDDSRPPQEALRIARILGIDNELIEKAENNLE